MDTVIPTIFPDYLIAVSTPQLNIQLPHKFLGRDVFPPMIRIPSTNNKLPELGHAGVLFINGKNGLTKYFEYGRYDRAALGVTRQVTIPDVAIDPKGRPTYKSLCKTLHQISTVAGQGGRISGAYIEVPTGGFSAMLAYCQKRVSANKDPQRAPYSLTTHSCIHFVKEVMEAGGVDTPWMLDPRPIGYIDRVRAGLPKLDYMPKKNTLSVENISLSGAPGENPQQAALGRRK
jgi:hypothetical protein